MFDCSPVPLQQSVGCTIGLWASPSHCHPGRNGQADVDIKAQPPAKKLGNEESRNKEIIAAEGEPSSPLVAEPGEGHQIGLEGSQLSKLRHIEKS